MKDNEFGEKTITVINKLLSDGVENISVLMRHSSRHYDKNPEKEPFMTLDETGKKLSYQFGKKLPLDTNIRFFLCKNALHPKFYFALNQAIRIYYS